MSPDRTSARSAAETGLLSLFASVSRGESLGGFSFCLYPVAHRDSNCMGVGEECTLYLMPHFEAAAAIEMSQIGPLGFTLHFGSWTIISSISSELD